MLKDSTNTIEVKMYPLVRRFFPNYEIFWDSFLTDGIGPDKHWKDGPLELLGIANYGILKSLNYIRSNYDKICVNDENQTFKNIYYHFGIICELIPYSCRYVFEFLFILGARNRDFTFADETICDKQMIRLLKYFIKDNDDFEKFKVFYENITSYRHFFTHNPGIDIVNNNGKIRVIGRSYLENCRKLSSLRKIYSSNPEYAVNPISQAFEDLIEMLEILNSIWDSFVKEMSTAKKEKIEKYCQILNI